jgi:hypothetical protein
MDRSFAGTSPRAARGYQFTACTIVFILSLFLIALLQQRAGSHRAELSGFPDESAHYVTGLMVRGYVMHGWRSAAPVPFAEDYYLHYPKVAFGHYPPGFYVVQLAWMTLFPTTISSLLYLQAVLLAAVSAFLFAIARGRFGAFAAAVLCAVFLILGPTQVLASEIMSEPLLTLLTLLGTWAIARYFETGRSAFLIWFVVFVEIATLTKGSGLELVGLPLLLAFGLRRADQFRNRTFWLAQLAMVAILTPWQILTWKMVRNGMVHPGVQRAVEQARELFVSMVETFGWPLLIVIFCGACLAVASRKHPDPLLAACAITAALTFIFHSVIPESGEGRRLYMAIPGALVVAYALVWRALAAVGRRSWAPVVLLTLAVIPVLPLPVSFYKTAVGYRAVSAWLLHHSGSGNGAVFVASDIDGEGMLVSEIAQSQPEPSMYIVRAIKSFEDCDWDSRDCHLIITDPVQAQQLLDSIPVGYVVVDRFPGIPSHSHTEMVWRMIAARPDAWVLRETQAAKAPPAGTAGEIMIYQRLGPISQKIHLRVNLNRMIGRVIGE